MTKIKVAFDACAYPKHLTGAGYYIKNIVEKLDSSNNIDLKIICKKSDLERLSDLAPNSQIINSAPDNKALRVAFQSYKLGSLVDNLNVDIFHGPHYQLPLKINTPCVVTVHDLTFLTHKNVHEFKKQQMFSKIIPFAAKKSKSIITVSQHTADDLEKLVPNHGKIFVAPLGIDFSRFNEQAHPEDRKILKSRGIPENYISFLGTFEPRKSIPTLIEAFTLIADKFPSLKLVLAGSPGWGTKQVRQAIVQSGLATRIICPGRLSDDEIPPFLRNSKVFIFPSMYEGFGMPVAEAMACGTPTITTNSSSLKEVAGKGALLFDPGDNRKLSELISSLLEHDTLYKQMSAKALSRSKDFSWDRCAQHHIDAYKFAVGS